MKKFYVGIDVSKEKLDFCLYFESNVLKEEFLPNNSRELLKEFKRWEKEFCQPKESWIICAEYTGMYTYPLSCACEEFGVDLWLENPAQIKYRSGVQRGKNDKMDARKIAVYAERFISEMQLYSIPQKNMASLRLMVAERDLYVSDKKKYQGQLSDQQRFMSPNDFKVKSRRLKSVIDELEKQIDEIDREIQKSIDNDETLSNQQKLLLTVDGVGERVAVKMIIETNGFKDFTDPRKFCCHAGVAPFNFTSGSSVRSRNKVSNRADKSIKSLLHMAALVVTTTKKDGELREYYLRKVAEGKNKMTVINAVRAKLVYRMFAVIRDNKFYEKNYVHQLA
jgi:transposase